MQVALRCIHCRRNQTRHLRSGRGNWTCRYCDKLNPGPALSQQVLVTAADATKRRKPVRVSRRPPEAVPSSSTPAAAGADGTGGNPAPAPAAAAPTEIDPKSGSLWGRLVLGEQ